jgi:GNAT superfamily N-acetyltransferase
MEHTEHRLTALLNGAALGEFPAADGTVELLPPPPGPAMAVVAFTERYIIATSAPQTWVREQLPAGDLLAPMAPRFLAALGVQLGRRDDGVDILLAAPALAGTPTLVEVKREAHPRVLRANAHRQDVRVFEDPSGAAAVILGRGLALRTEVAVEVEHAARGRGLATRALVEARRLAGPGEALFAQTAPGNAASLRALLSAGFRPIGSEVLFFDD